MATAMEMNWHDEDSMSLALATVTDAVFFKGVGFPPVGLLIWEATTFGATTAQVRTAMREGRAMRKHVR